MLYILKNMRFPIENTTATNPKQITPWRRVFLEKLIVCHLVKKFPANFLNPKFHYRVRNGLPLYLA
jgi:hypothetical protein